ncbi:MAG: HDOD domain-containing protein [Pseudomonadota bacterium]
MTLASNTPPQEPPRASRGLLLKQLCGDEDLFALGAAVARVVQLADADDQGAQSLAYFVLADVALTQKILRQANTPLFRSAAGGTVTTVSRAISLLGFDHVKASALAMLLVDTLANSGHAHSVRLELEVALCASLFGRELARSGAWQGAEEVAIGALFKNIGALLVASREHERFGQIAALAGQGELSLGQASQQVLGTSYEALSAAILHEWKIPELIIHSLSAPPPGALRPAANRHEWMRQVVAFSAEAARLLVRRVEPAGAEGAALALRYGAALNLDAGRVAALFGAVGREMDSLLDSMQLAPAPAPAAAPAADSLPAALRQAALTSATAGAGVHPSGKPLQARELLLAGVQDVSQMRAQMRAAGAVRANQLIQAVLETLYRSMGFRFATVCLKDVRAGQYRARIAFGEQNAARLAGFAFPLRGGDLFHLALDNDADLMIADAFAPNIAELLPPWHRALLPDARSFIVLPLVLAGAPLGLFYADRVHAAPEGVPADEASLIRALKAQVLAALAPPP